MLSDSEPDSDVELQEAFSKGYIKPGLNVETAPTQRIINNVEGMKRKLEEFSKASLGWLERLDVVAKAEEEEDMELGPDKLENDYIREMKFYKMAAASTQEGLRRLGSLGVPTKRPPDFYAEMAKSDDHMKRVREKLLQKKLSLERSEKAKKLRQLRKYGKKVQQETLLRRQKEKKELLDGLKKYKKGQTDRNVDDILKQPQPDRPHQPNKKRQYKNKKFGFGGQKKRSKRNTSESAKDMGGFKPRVHQPKTGKKGPKKRPGKVARKKNKHRK